MRPKDRTVQLSILSWGSLRFQLAENESPRAPLGAQQGGHATTRFLEGFLEGSLKEVFLRRVLRRRLVRVSVGREVLRRVLRRGGGAIEGA